MKDARINPVGYRICSYSIINDRSGAASNPRASKYAISTDSYVPQDGWVLLPSGFKPRSTMPILHEHGWSGITEMPLGKWASFEVKEREIHAMPVWSENLTDDEKQLKARIDEALLSVSIRFNVTDWHAPDDREREKYGIPQKAHFAGVATSWDGLEASFVSVPADPKAGPRALALAHARAALAGETAINIVSADDLAALRLVLDRGFASINTMLEQLQVAIQTQRVAKSNEATTSAPGAGIGTRNGDAERRNNLYNKDALGISSALDALLLKMPKRKD